MCFFLDAFFKYACYCIFYDHVSGNMHKLKVNFYDCMYMIKHACFIMLHNEACNCSLIACTCIIVTFVLLSFTDMQVRICCSSITMLSFVASVTVHGIQV